MRKTYEKPILTRRGVLSPAFNGSLSQAVSDRRLKTNVARIGTTVFGLPLYRFSYLGGGDTFTGVMAQDVLGVMPRAVCREASGFYRVNYAMLGIEMERVG